MLKYKYAQQCVNYILEEYIMKTIERICDEVREEIKKNPKADFHLEDATVNALLAEASKIATEDGKMVLTYDEEGITFEFQFCGKLCTEPPSFTRIVTVRGKGLDYYQQYPSYNGTIL